MSAWHDHGNEHHDFEDEDEPYIALDYAEGDPNPLGEEGVTECWLIVDGEPVPGVVLTRRRSHAERLDLHGEMELLFIPEEAPE